MKLSKMITLLLIALTTVAGIAGDGDKKKHAGKTINVEFENMEDESMSMNMTLPVTFIQSLQPQIEQFLSQLEVEGQEIDLPAVWASLKDAGPTEFLEVKNKDADIKVSTTATHLLIQIDEKENDQHIELTLPLALGDALLGDNLENIDYEKIIDALVEMEGQDLLKLDSKKAKGRVWIE